MTQFGKDRNGRHEGNGADRSKAPRAEASEGDLNHAHFGSLEVQDRIKAISEIYDTFFYSIDSWIEAGEEIIEIEHFFLTGDMQEHIQELAHPFDVEFHFENREGDASAGEEGE